MNPFFLKPKFRKTKRKRSFYRGFTLVELMVTVSVLIVITSIALAGYSRFGSVTELRNAAHEISVSISKARIYGIGSAAQNNLYDKPYGIHFDKSSPNSYVIFIDLDEGGFYSGNSENVKIVSVNKKFEIGKICGVLPGGSTDCSPSFDYLDILFERPLPEVLIKSNLSNNYQEAEIYLNAGDENDVIIEINLTGRVSVE